MKKTSIISSAFLWVLLASCAQLEPDTPAASLADIPAVEEGETFVFSSGKDAPEDVSDTKTVYSDGTILWSAGDMIRMAFTVNDVWQGASGNASSYSNARIYASEALGEGGLTAEFTVPTNFTGTPAGTYKFYTVYPQTICGSSFSGEGKVTATLPATQTPPAGSFDPKADLMVGTSIRTYTSKPTEAIPLLWSRLVSHAHITLKDIKGLVSGETVRSVTLTAQDGCVLTGTHTLDITDGTLTAVSGSSSNSVTVNGTNLSFDGKNLEFWACILPVTVTDLNVTLVTDRATYTRSITGISKTFKANAHCTLGITMATCSRFTEQEVYEKVTSGLSDWSGDYLIVYENGPFVLSGVSNNLGMQESVVISNETISWGDYKQYNVSVGSDGSGYSLYLEGLGYLGAKDGNNLLFANSVSSDAYRWTFSVDSEGNVWIVNRSYTDRQILYNVSNPRFCAYKLSSLGDFVKTIQLYRRATVPVSSDPVATASVTTGAATSVTTAGATLNGSFSGATGTVYEVGFYWGTSASSLVNHVDNDGFNTSSGSFTCSLSSLDAGRTYFYQAYVLEFNATTNRYEERFGSVLSFTTSSGGTVTTPGYLVCYEMPALSVSGSGSNGNERWNNDGGTSGGVFPKWYMYNLSPATRKVITHTYKYGGTVYRNYTAIVDQTKRCPVLTCYVMHSGAYPDNNIGRQGSFNESVSYDPGIPQSWQSSGSTSDYNNGTGYARGHHCASNDRQTALTANYQTFYYTNQSPQIQNSFNDGVWEDLESAVQSRAPSGRDTLYVNVGTLFEDGNTGSSNDGGTVARPSHFYKCLMLCSFDSSGTMTSAQGVAYLYTNAAHSGHYYDAAYMTTIDAIEQRSGFDLFANVPSGLQEAAEQMTRSLW